MSIQNKSVKNQQITVSSLVRRYNNQTILNKEIEKHISDEFITRVVTKIIMGVPLNVTGIESIEGKFTAIDGSEEIVALMHFINNSVTLTDSLIEEISNKTFDQLDSLILNLFIDQKITISSFSPDTNINFLQNFFGHQLTVNEINKYLKQ